MKQKLLSILTLLLTICSGAWATDETPGNTGSSDENIVGTSYTIAGTYIAGTGGKKVSPMVSKGVKVRLTASGTNNSLTIAVNSGYIINDLTIYAVTNTDNASCTVTSVKVDGTEAGSAPYTIAAKNASTASTIALTDIDATENIVLSFGDVGGKGQASQAHFDFHFTYTQIPAGPSISASNVNIAASATGGSIAYTVNNPVVGGAVTAIEKGTSGWLTAVGTETTSPISFTAEANTGAERSATVTLTYTYNTSETVEKDVTITQAAKTYTITYDKGTYGTGDIVAGQKNHGVAFTLSSEKFTRAGYEQTGWATSDGGIKAYELGGSYTDNADITLYPVWEEAKYTVIYNVNGGGSCATESATQPTVGATLTLPTPTWDGYAFDGWYNDGIEIGDAGAEYTPTANITLYAKWTDNIEGKLFSYVDGNYGDKFKPFDGSDWVTANADNKNKTFTDVTTGAQYIINKGNWDKKNNSISALAKFKNGTTEMSIIIPTGYQATVKILYGAYGTGNDYKMTVNGTDQASPNAKFVDDHTNAQIASDMRDITLNNQTGTLTLSVNGDKNIYIGRVAVTLTHVSANITEAGYATFSSTKKLDFTDVEGLTAYKATATSESSVTLEDVTGVVPAETGLLLKGAANTYYIPVSTADATANVTGNKLQSTATAAHNIAAGEVGRAFVFGKLGEEVGFFKAAEGKTIGAGKSYLLLDAAPAKDVEFLSFVFGDEESETTGIKAVVNEQAREGIYDLQGRKVTNPTKGLYIVNGKKVIIK